MQKPETQELQSAFPLAEIDDEHIYFEGPPFARFYRQLPDFVVLDGEFSGFQLIALARFVTRSELPSLRQEQVTAALQPIEDEVRRISPDWFSRMMVDREELRCAIPYRRSPMRQPLEVYYRLEREINYYLIRGKFSIEQLQAFAFWVAHPEAFTSFLDDPHSEPAH